MPRISGVPIPDNKNILIALTYIYGVGSALSAKILKEAQIKPDVKASSLKPEELNLIKDIMKKNCKIEGGLRRELMTHIKRLKDIGSWRGMRHMKKLPVRGQTTRTNTRTVKGNVRKTMGSGRKPAATPT
jgi:small subunit ribosomal protein S13